MSAPRVVAVGGMNMDIAAHSHASLRAGDSNPGSMVSSPGGVARNVAENLCRLGASVSLVSVLGDDAFGASLVEHAQRIGLDLRACTVLAGQRTGTYLSLHGPDGDMALAINAMDIFEQLTPQRLQPHSDLFASARALVLDGNVPADSLHWLLENTPTVPNFADAVSVSKCLRLKPLLGNLFTLKVNTLEAQALTGIAVQGIDTALDAARALCHAGVQRVVLTLGNRGAVWCAPGQQGHLPARSVAVANTTGAGDALLAGLVWGHLAGWTLERATRWAMACAEITVQSPYANAPELSLSRVEQHLESESASK